MKVQTQQSTFQPINIVIETKEELQFFTALLGAVSTNDMKAFGVADSDIYEQLLKSLDSDSGEIGFITKLDKQVPAVEGAEVDWSKVPRGTNILVRDHECEVWVERIFISYNRADAYPYFCTGPDLGNHLQVGWKSAKLIL